MAQEETYIAVVSERLSKPGDTRYIIIDRQTREVKDDSMGRGYKSAQAAHKSFAFKQRRHQQRETARQMQAQYQVASCNARQSARPLVVKPKPLRIQTVTQENTTPPTPDLFDFKNQ